MDASTRMTCSKLAGIGLLLCLLAACGANPNASPISASTPLPVVPATSATVSYCADRCDASGDSFAIDSARDLTILLGWKNLSAGKHTQSLDILTPEGGVYQSMQSEFQSSDLKLEDGVPTARTTLPIAGSWIQQRNATGTWTVNLYLDGQLVGSSSLHLR